MKDTWEDKTDAEVDAGTMSAAVLLAREQVQSDAQVSLLTTLTVIFIILLGITLLTKDLNFLSLSLLKPLRTLAEEMQSIVQLQIAGLNMEEVKMEKSCAEIRMINRIFNNMKKAIKSWGKYVPWPVVQILLRAGVDAEPGMKTKEVTIFFSDIAGFTTIVEHLDPEQSLLLLSRYFNDMSKVIDDHQGIVIEFIGDAILSVFGSPMKNPDHSTACVKAALGMLSALDKINHWALARGLPEIRIRCGVHTGRVMIGNMGFQSRMKYGVVGAEATVADKLEEINKNYGTNLLISQATYQRISHDAFVIRPIDVLRFSHRGDSPKAEMVYNVMTKDRLGTIKHKLRPVATLHMRGIRRYRDRQFAEALELFREVNSMMKKLMAVEEDPPAVLMIKRCETYLANPPPLHWDGVWDEK
eukprot:CAMPEP_0183452840 /NCGR_PEP_ID=MMETSP0370-20130417/119174_1 /TAXON_ID=268820 /ORGANISM="Peridinium aciculiferum, Strain PAER-2" /LENGTH=413 /DNA_ID=CAMNT_0025644169 /DNA_START=45 /DNA_END=1286 /DNA_ORIENTATION=+